MPITRSNLSAKKDTASLPINPPDPVIRAIFIRRLFVLSDKIMQMQPYGDEVYKEGIEL